MDCIRDQFSMSDTVAPKLICDDSSRIIVARSKHHAVFDGQQMIVWGGHPDFSYLVISADGTIYDPVTDVWSALPTQNAPDPVRGALRDASVVRTGTDMLVWSGGPLNTGSGNRYFHQFVLFLNTPL